MYRTKLFKYHIQYNRTIFRLIIILARIRASFLTVSGILRYMK